MIEMRLDDGGLYIRLQNSPRVTALLIQQWMTRVVAYIHSQVDAGIEKGGGLIGRRTGTLARAIMDRVIVTATGAIGEVWPDLSKAPYGAIQEFGGTVVPKNGQALAIPLEAMLTANGVARGTAMQVKHDPQAFGYRSTFIPHGHDVIMGTPIGEHTAIPLFALKPSVVIPATHYLSTPFTQALVTIAGWLEDMTQDAVSILFEGAGDVG